jgi:hypothetical protein
MMVSPSNIAVDPASDFLDCVMEVLLPHLRGLAAEQEEAFCFKTVKLGFASNRLVLSIATNSLLLGEPDAFFDAEIKVIR